MAIKDGEKAIMCPICGKNRLTTYFNLSCNPHHKNGRLPFCRACLLRLHNEYTERTGDEKSALWLLCAEVGVPMRKEVYADALIQFQQERVMYPDIPLFTCYFDSVHKFHEKYPDYALATFADTDMTYDEIKDYRVKEIKMDEALKDYRFIWGQDKTMNDIKYLEYRFNIYTKDKELTDYQEKLYRSLCLAELAEYKGDDNIDKQQKIAKTLKLDQFQNEEEHKTLVEEMLETQIYEMEKKMPCEMYDNKELYKDYCGIGEYWDKHILRCLRNLIAGTKDYPTVSKEYLSKERKK